MKPTELKLNHRRMTKLCAQRECEKCADCGFAKWRHDLPEGAKDGVDCPGFIKGKVYGSRLGGPGGN